MTLFLVSDFNRSNKNLKMSSFIILPGTVNAESTIEKLGLSDRVVKPDSISPQGVYTPPVWISSGAQKFMIRAEVNPANLKKVAGWLWTASGGTDQGFTALIEFTFKYPFSTYGLVDVLAVWNESEF
jgi:hypothetical protein